MTEHYPFHEVGRLPAPGDNVAIAVRTLPAGAAIDYEGDCLCLEGTILEGHRFAIRPIAAHEALLSWGLPFGYARRAMAPGAYVCNARILEALRSRHLPFALPPEPNFYERIVPYRLDEARLQPGTQVALHPQPRTFLGYQRGPTRGVGTRNYIVIVGTSSRTAGYVRGLEARLRGRTAPYARLDGIVAVAHTEGGGPHQPHNLELLLRTLSGFLIHPNVGAVLAVDDGRGPVTNALLRRYMQAHDYPLAAVRHHFLTLRGELQTDLEAGASIVQAWLPQVNEAQRGAQSLAHLKVALQCGGSDAFSGISGNPLVAWAAKEIIRYGGAANLAETDELIGAEAYVLQNVRDLDTARAFLAAIERFQARVAWHGHSAEGNPSGGNNYRGLYNITLKSLGAAMKRHPQVRLDYVIEYGQRMAAPGFYFMDSPGNDLESIAGQVAAGANMIFFITGNGSITNFPFVPTLKVITTTSRFRLLWRDMDVNAGAYLDGTPLPELGQRLLDLSVATASGAYSAGEKAGHAQVSIWRDWPQVDASHLARLQQAPAPTGIPLPVKAMPVDQRFTFTALRTANGYATEQLGLLLPASLCAAQIAQLIAARLQARWGQAAERPCRFVALPHTEGCGVSGGPSEALFARTLLGYLLHPMVKGGLVLEHGCEKTHNDYMAAQLAQRGIDRHRFGWASVQQDGGIERVTAKVEAWFEAALGTAPAPGYALVGLEALRLGLLAAAPLSAAMARSLARLTRQVVSAGGTVVIPETASLLSSAAYLDDLGGPPPAAPSLAYGQAAPTPGLHVMETPTGHWVETFTGLGATGVEVMLACVDDPPLQAHPLIPLLHVATANPTPSGLSADLDLVLAGEPEPWPERLLRLVLAVAARAYRPKLFAHGHTDFQITRGRLGVSL